MQALRSAYPWTKGPLICAAPMRLIALSQLVTAVTEAGGLGFIGAGSDVSTLKEELDRTRQLLSGAHYRTAHQTLPVGVGFLLWGLQVEQVTSIIAQPQYRPAAIWLFAPRQTSDLAIWSTAIREATDGMTKVWIQVGAVADAVAAVKEAQPDVLVVQGQDAGGHGLTKGAGLIPLLPEVKAAVAAVSEQPPLLVATGGIVDGACAAAAIALGAHGVCLGTKVLATPEANISDGYRQAVIRAKDGGVTTTRTHVYDTLRGTTSWPKQYGGRGVVNASYWDFEQGMDMQENKKLYEESLKRGDAGWDESGGRLTTYAGTGVGLVNKLQGAAEVVTDLRRDMVSAIRRASEEAGAFGEAS